MRFAEGQVAGHAARGRGLLPRRRPTTPSACTSIVESLDRLLSTAHDAHLARITVQQNDDMRKISAWVAIAAVPTLVAGIYGMNFEHMPELRWTLRLPARDGA